MAKYLDKSNGYIMANEWDIIGSYHGFEFDGDILRDTADIQWIVMILDG
jgi:hypothetical protein